MENIKELKEMIANAYKNSNFFDSQYKIEELKKKFDIKLLTKLVRNKKLKICKADEKQFNKEYDELQGKYLLRRKVFLWEEPPKYITHRYKYGEWVLFRDYNELRTGHIIKINKNGYKIFTGRKIGVHCIVKEKDVICHVPNTKRMMEEFKNHTKK